MSGIGSRKVASGTFCGGGPESERNGELRFEGPAAVGAVVPGPGVADADGRAGWGTIGRVAAPDRRVGTVTPGMINIGRTGDGAAGCGWTRNSSKAAA